MMWYLPILEIGDDSININQKVAEKISIRLNFKSVYSKVQDTFESKNITFWCYYCSL